MGLSNIWRAGYSPSSQDLLSYNKEQAVGDDEHNIVTVIMKEFDLDVQEAFDEAGRLSDRKIDRFYHLYNNLPRWAESVNLDVHRFVNDMAQCVSGVMHWSYESQRYFGNRGLVVKQTRLMQMLPRVIDNSNIGPVPVDDTKI